MSWNDASITATVRAGGFRAGQDAFLYVVDADGSVNVAGYPVTFGTTGNRSSRSVAGVIPASLSASPIPFNRTVTLTLAGAAPVTQVKLCIYDCRGICVQNRALATGVLRQGLTWDAGRYHSGFYTAKVMWGDRFLTCRLLFIK